MIKADTRLGRFEVRPGTGFGTSELALARSELKHWAEWVLLAGDGVLLAAARGWGASASPPEVRHPEHWRPEGPFVRLVPGLELEFPPGKGRALGGSCSCNPVVDLKVPVRPWPLGQTVPGCLSTKAGLR